MGFVCPSVVVAPAGKALSMESPWAVKSPERSRNGANSLAVKVQSVAQRQGTTLELVRNAESQPPPRPTESESAGGRDSQGIPVHVNV